MKNTPKLGLLGIAKSLILLSLLMTVGYLQAVAEEISLVADEWCPFNCGAQDVRQGILVDVAKEVFGKAGYTVTYSVKPWARAMLDTRLGKHTAILGATEDEATDFIFPKNPMMQSYSSFFTLKDSKWEYKDISSLDAVSLGAIRDYTYAEEINKYIAKNKSNFSKVQLASGDDASKMNIEKLMAGRVNVVIEDVYVMRYNLALMNRQQAVREVGTVELYPMLIAFSPVNPKSKELAAILDAGVVEMQKNGRMAELLKDYGMENSKSQASAPAAQK